MYKETKLHTGSPMPKKPESKPSGGVAGSGPGKYHPEGAAKHLKGQDSCVPMNSGPMELAGYGKDHE